MAEQRFAASFRGVPFFVESATDTAGQHTIVHEFPGRKPVVDHNGPMPQRFRLDCVLIGPNYQSDLIALEDAFAQPGPGRLVHHWRGSFLASVDGEYTVTRSTNEGGMARISATFVVAGEEAAPSVRVETFDLVITEGEIANARMADLIDADFDATGSNALRERSVSILGDVSSLVSSANNRIQSQFSAAQSVGAQVTAFARGVETLIDTPHTMATSISGLIGSVFDALLGVVDSVGEIDPLGDTSKILGALLRGRQIVLALGLFRAGDAFGSDYSTPGDSTPGQVQRGRNQDLLTQSVRVAHVVAFTASVARVGIDSRQRAEQVFDAVADAVADLRGDVDDQTYRALVNLRVAFGSHLRVQAAQLPDVIEHTPVNTLPALLLAHTLYNDATREAEIVERNAILHPGFIRGNVDIEVLSA